MKTEEKAKVVAAVWGIEFIQFLAVPCSYCAMCTIGFEEEDELHQDDLKKRMNTSYSLKFSYSTK